MRSCRRISLATTTAATATTIFSCWCNLAFVITMFVVAASILDGRGGGASLVRSLALAADLGSAAGGAASGDETTIYGVAWCGDTKVVGATWRDEREVATRFGGVRHKEWCGPVRREEQVAARLEERI